MEQSTAQRKLVKSPPELWAEVSSEVLRTKTAAETNAGLFGAEYLAFNFAVIDVSGLALYLRHAESR